MATQVTPEEWASQMLEMMSPAIRKRLIRRIVNDLRKQNAESIRRQQSPDGEAWEKRKKRNPKKRKMLTGLAKRKHLKAKATADQGTVGYSGRAAVLAKIHHYGMLDNVSKYGPRVEYPARPLIGITQQSIDNIEALILEWHNNV